MPILWCGSSGRFDCIDSEGGMTAVKIFFIVPPNIHYIEPYAFVKADKSNTVRPYLGLLYIAAALRKSLGIEARIVDSNADGLTLEDIGEIIRRETPDLIGFSVLT